MAPAVLIMPQTDEHGERTLQGHESKHFITPREFEKWARSHPSVRPGAAQPAPPPTSTGAPVQPSMKAPASMTQYKAPHHPTSQLLQSIPPRAPIRSSRSKILAYTLHMATTSRVSSYGGSSTGIGPAAVLYRAESKDTLDEDEQRLFKEGEAKSRGLVKLSESLLTAARNQPGDAGGLLPEVVERRVTLAFLANDLLASPLEFEALAGAVEFETVSSDEVDSLQTLVPLTSGRRSTVIYNATGGAYRAATGAPRSAVPGTSASGGQALAGGMANLLKEGRPRSSTSVVAQSLMALKFGNTASPPGTPSGRENRTANASQLSSALNAVASGSGTREPSLAEKQWSQHMSATPHMDYRIVQGQAMRNRAQEIFQVSVIERSVDKKENKGCWCRRHRVNECVICFEQAAETGSRTLESPTSTTSGKRSFQTTSSRLTVKMSSQTIAGQGLQPTNRTAAMASKKPFAETLPEFLELSAQLLRDCRRERAVAKAEGQSPAMSPREQAREKVIVPMQGWYDLLRGFLIQACLEGYLVDGWTGTNGIETLFGVGCGVWEGKVGWAEATAVPPPPAVKPKPRALQKLVSPRVSAAAYDTTDDDDSDDDDEEDSVAEELRRKQMQRFRLTAAARDLFLGNELCQAEFERSMRDAKYEFLHIPDNESLYTHLSKLNTKYALSTFEKDVVEFLSSASKFLGDPSLVKREATATNHNSKEADVYALMRYFAYQMPDRSVDSYEGAPISRKRTLTPLEGFGPNQRRRIDPI